MPSVESTVSRAPGASVPAMSAVASCTVRLAVPRLPVKRAVPALTTTTPAERLARVEMPVPLLVMVPVVVVEPVKVESTAAFSVGVRGAEGQGAVRP